MFAAVLPGQSGTTGAAAAFPEVREKIYRRKAAAVAFSMGWQEQPCQPGGRECAGGSGWVPAGDAEVPVAAPGRFVRAGGRGADGRPAVSLPYLSLEPAFRRGHGMVYQGLAEGRIDEEALRDLLVAVRPREWPLVFAIDASTYPRPWAATSPGREWHHHSCPGIHGSDGAAVAGWAFQWLAQLSFAPDSWTAPQDQVRTGAGDDATGQAARQIMRTRRGCARTAKTASRCMCWTPGTTRPR